MNVPDLLSEAVGADPVTRTRVATTTAPADAEPTRVTRTSVSIVTAGDRTTSLTRSPPSSPTTATRSSTTSSSPTLRSTSSSSIRVTSSSSISSSSSTRSSSTLSSSSSSSSSALTTSTSTFTVAPSSSSVSSSASSALIPDSSSEASKGGKDDDGGMKLGTGAIAAISVAGALAALALLLVSYRYYKRRQRQNNRMSLSIWAAGDHHTSDRHSGANTGGWGKRESEVETNEKDVTPYQIGRDDDEEYGYGQQRAMGGGSGYSAYPPQQLDQGYYAAPGSGSGGYIEPRVDAYGRPLSDPSQQQHQQGYPYGQQYPTPPPVIGVIPGTPNTFGSQGGENGSVAGSGQGNPLAMARERGLVDGSKVVVKQGFVRSLEDELVIAPGDSLLLVQAYDDGWCLCKHSRTHERGVVPLNCLASGEGQEVLNVPEGENGGMARSPTADSLANSDRSQRRSSLFVNAQAAGLYLQQSPTK